MKTHSLALVALLSCLHFPSCKKEAAGTPSAADALSASPQSAASSPFRPLSGGAVQQTASASANAADPLTALKGLLADRNMESDIGKKDEALEIVRTLAGQKRQDAIPVLLDGFTVIRPFSIAPGSGEFGGYPCLEALIAIGRPSVLPMETRFFSSPLPREQFIIFGALVEIRGSTEIADWLDKLPENGPRSLAAVRREELKSYALSLEKPGQP